MALSEVKLRNDDRYPAAPDGVDASEATDGYVWTYDAASGGYIAKPANDHSHEKLERLPDAETSQRVVYVSPNGIDSGSGSSSSPWKTIQYAVNQARSFMQIRNSTSAYKIVCATGVYSQGVIVIPATLFGSFTTSGGGGIWIVSETGTAADVTISCTSAYAGVQVYGQLTLESVTVEVDSSAIATLGSPTTFAYVRQCNLRRASLANGGVAALMANAGALHSDANSSEAGRQFQYGLRASQSARISRQGAQPTGSVANELSLNGGLIT